MWRDRKSGWTSLENLGWSGHTHKKKNAEGARKAQGAKMYGVQEMHGVQKCMGCRNAQGTEMYSPSFFMVSLLMVSMF